MPSRAAPLEPVSTPAGPAFSTPTSTFAVKAAWLIYQRIIPAPSQPDRRRGNTMTTKIIDPLRRGRPTAPDEIIQPGSTPHHRRHDILAHFDHHASNGPTEAINRRLEALRRNTLGLRNRTHCRIRSLLHCGNLIQQINAL